VQQDTDTKPPKSEAWRYTIDLVTGAVTGARVYSVDGYSDFPQLNSKLIGREAQFGYFLYYDPATTDPTGIVQAHITSDSVHYTVACTTGVHKQNYYVYVWSHECPKTRDIYTAHV
jgi:carotenoid cleavage dioxygenase-like enzyme